MSFLVRVLLLPLLISKSRGKMSDAEKKSGFLNMFKHFCIGKRNLPCYCIMFLIL